MRKSLSRAALVVLCACGARTPLETDDSLESPCIPAASGEICDGVDNDCDGAIDEDLAPVTCGELGCETTVRCEGGVMPVCVPREPSPEVCNLRDDDCDGAVDEGFGFGPLAEAIILRDDEFDTGDCTSCKWAWGPGLAPAGEGFLALWNLGLSGGERQPTLYGRSVDVHGAPTSPVELLRQDFLLQLRPMLGLEPLPARGMPFDVTYRVGSSDVPGLLFVQPDGTTETEMPVPASGPINVPRMVWTGARFIAAWEEDSQLQVAILDANGIEERRADVAPLERPAAITIGLYPGRVGILVSRYEDATEARSQWLIVLDELGQVTTPARQLDVEWTSWQRLVGTEPGWLHVRPNDWDVPSTRQPLDVDGDPLGEALPFPDGRHFDDSGLQDTFVPRPGRGEMIVAWQSPVGGDMHVELLDWRGEILRGWAGPLQPDPGYEEGYLVNPHITFANERVLVTWHGLSDDATPNRVMVRELGCVP
jgi:hypothetical protein